MCKLILIQVCVVLCVLTEDAVNMVLYLVLCLGTFNEQHLNIRVYIRMCIILN